MLAQQMMIVVSARRPTGSACGVRAQKSRAGGPFSAPAGGAAPRGAVRRDHHERNPEARGWRRGERRACRDSWARLCRHARKRRHVTVWRGSDTSGPAPALPAGAPRENGARDVAEGGSGVTSGGREAMRRTQCCTLWVPLACVRAAPALWCARVLPEHESARARAGLCGAYAHQRSEVLTVPRSPVPSLPSPFTPARTLQPASGSQMLSYKPPDFVFRRNYGWYGTAGVGDGEFDTNRAAKGYDW
jgi:hypothetical protein